jgi:hypothetical protein
MIGLPVDPSRQAAGIDGIARALTMATLAGQAMLNAGLVWAALWPALALGASAAMLRAERR